MDAGAGYVELLVEERLGAAFRVAGDGPELVQAGGGDGPLGGVAARPVWTAAATGEASVGRTWIGILFWLGYTTDSGGNWTFRSGSA